ncbi:[pt] photosystem I subunit XI [Galdieria sulphuraria]|uniref:PSI subunit V n=1 Tax=Galdieria sulphuraria TaxID=130081 RepID=M2XEV6_GALSU|nr:[pt] photosystem I subunit XI [Galdieria sulphuraria]EME28522.1 [pt] photosystem I subunit XI [Galdieria sulphuraria]|eukprot:XP_005705042.1 [pt] photosystem I subunit XI [Galdieria sulphuraria]
MTDFIKPYNDDPFVGNLATPINTSSLTKNLLEIGMAHGYFFIGPFYKLGPLRNSEIALLSGFLSCVGLIIFLTVGLLLYGNTSFDKDESKDQLQTSEGWNQFTAGFLVGAIGGAGFAYLILVNL